MLVLTGKHIIISLKYSVNLLSASIFRSPATFSVSSLIPAQQGSVQFQACLGYLKILISIPVFSGTIPSECKFILQGLSPHWIFISSREKSWYFFQIFHSRSLSLTVLWIIHDHDLAGYCYFYSGLLESALVA